MENFDSTDNHVLATRSLKIAATEFQSYLEGRRHGKEGRSPQKECEYYLRGYNVGKLALITTQLRERNGFC